LRTICPSRSGRDAPGDRLALGGLRLQQVEELLLLEGNARILQHGEDLLALGDREGILLQALGFSRQYSL